MILESVVLNASLISEKLSALEGECERALSLTHRENVPTTPARAAKVCRIHELPAKPGLSTQVGQARLLHDLASIELQAMELGLRTLLEFPEAPRAFREDLVALTLEEARHLKMCESQLLEMGFSFGHWPVHLGLWQTVREDDSLLRRILLVHRYLEGAGLDAGDSILRRLSGVEARAVTAVVQWIVDEEIEHVAFGSKWYREICRSERVDADDFFRESMREFTTKVPRREKLDIHRRRRAGFSEAELECLESLEVFSGAKKSPLALRQIP